MEHQSTTENVAQIFNSYFHQKAKIQTQTHAVPRRNYRIAYTTTPYCAFQTQSQLFHVLTTNTL